MGWHLGKLLDGLHKQMAWQYIVVTDYNDGRTGVSYFLNDNDAYHVFSELQTRPEFRTKINRTITLAKVENIVTVHPDGEISQGSV